jgi:hypothetical protein
LANAEAPVLALSGGTDVRLPLRRNAGRAAVGGRVDTRLVAVVATLVLTAASVLVALGSPSLSSTPTAGGASTKAAVTSGATALSLSVQAESDAAAERDFVLAERAEATRELEASALSDEVKAVRQEVAERATRDAERAKLASLSPRELGQMLAAQAGWTGSQWSCLDSLWMRESRWDPTARNTSSGAFGIPQALPGSKMASAGADWATNPATQIAWGFGYIRDRYGTPCGAWSHSEAVGWY